MIKPKIIDLKVAKDLRGNFKKLFDLNLKKKISSRFDIHQINISENIKKGTIRGMHGSKSKPGEAKLIYCLSGKFYDVLVDYNKTSNTFLKKFYFELDCDDDKLLFVPEGYLHGFQTLKNNTKIMYFHNNHYFPKLDIGLNPLDKKLNINWPIRVSCISEKDLTLPNLRFNL